MGWTMVGGSLSSGGQACEKNIQLNKPRAFVLFQESGVSLKRRMRTDWNLNMTNITNCVLVIPKCAFILSRYLNNLGIVIDRNRTFCYRPVTNGQLDCQLGQWHMFCKSR
jgi:hypothetical protein